jgi:hypothetical protein
MEKIRIALLYTSVIFFEPLVVFWLFFFMLYSHLHHYYLRLPGDILFAVSPLLSIISLFGALIFVTEMKSRANRWYLGIPLCIAILLTIIADIAMILSSFQIGGLHLLPYTLLTFSYTAWTMLAPCSVFFFLSVPAEGMRKAIIPALALISGIVSSCALYSYYYLLRVMFTHVLPYQRSLVSLLQWGHVFVGMPVIGISLVAVAIRYK